jgi:hypothetical protein
MLATFAPHNSDARQPQDASKWPPAIIVDLFYAAAVSQTWGPKTFVRYAKEKARDAYYDNVEGYNNGSSDGDPGNATEDPNTRRTRVQATEHSADYALLNERRTETVDIADQSNAARFGELVDGVMALWMQSARKVKEIRKIPALANAMIFKHG